MSREAGDGLEAVERRLGAMAAAARGTTRREGAGWRKIALPALRERRVLMVADVAWVAGTRGGRRIIRTPHQLRGAGLAGGLAGAWTCVDVERGGGVRGDLMRPRLIEMGIMCGYNVWRCAVAMCVVCVWTVYEYSSAKKDRAYRLNACE